jgi:hypothetical protein
VSILVWRQHEEIATVNKTPSDHAKCAFLQFSQKDLMALYVLSLVA